MKISLIIADDHPALITGVKHELVEFHTISIVGTASNSTEIFELLAKSPCDVLVTDYVMPGGEFGDGLTMLSFLRRRYPDLKIIVFTTIDNRAMVAEMVKVGAHAVLSKVDVIGHLISAIHAVYAGATYFSPKFRSASAVGQLAQISPAQKLTRRETEVVRLYVSGVSINEIASQFNRSKQTISSQKTSAMRKLGIERDVELFRCAYEIGLLTEGSAQHENYAVGDMRVQQE
ncbi:response regulator transcription factor [Achromobacter piechaudii]|uniref:Response regulator receiver domain protein n=1 Tax=Achromobacter piechaudii ATCC 43553 TaxID=742159 RepID=D4XFM4_9BURK|nr:response regulator transcription factor [Achromobacter piechaudii]EFF74316.1 response regulator receiver domain protein [Achromobacter piechaudii ATCC 43553]